MPQIPRGHGEFRLFTEGDELYDTMLEAISRARKGIRLESYILADDEIGNRFVEALVERASAGLDVRLMIDSAGSPFWSSRRLCLASKGTGILSPVS